MLDGWHTLGILFVTAYVGTWAHEGAHYFAGYPWTSQHRIVMRYKIVPRRVDWSRTNLPTRVYRIAGAAPLIWLLPGVFIVHHEIYPLVASGNFFDAFVRLPLVAAGALSRKDIQSIISTEEWMKG